MINTALTASPATCHTLSPEKRTVSMLSRSSGVDVELSRRNSPLVPESTNSIVFLVIIKPEVSMSVLDSESLLFS